jgi:hypothetical protein
MMSATIANFQVELKPDRGAAFTANAAQLRSEVETQLSGTLTP